MKATIPAALCLIALLVCSWMIHLTRPESGHYKVEITVWGPDGKTIPAIRHR